VLFYHHTGSFEGGDLVIRCEDFYPMDLGTSGWTEYHMNEDVAAYMAQNMELFDCEIGLIHSHHRLGAFFSGQDINTLQVEGNDTNNFVSLIVDNAGNYVAAITRNVRTKREITVTCLESTYQFFGEGEVKSGDDRKEVRKEDVCSKVEYFMLDIEKPAVANPFDDMDRRFEEIEKRKKASAVTLSPGISDAWQPQKAEPGLFSERELEGVVQNDVANLRSSYMVGDESIRELVLRMLTCSLIMHGGKSNLKEWVDKYMVPVYDKQFGGVDMDAFTSWRDYSVEYSLMYGKDDSFRDMYPMLDDDSYWSVKAMAMQEELKTFVDPLHDNPYLTAYINELERWIY